MNEMLNTKTLKAAWIPANNNEVIPGKWHGWITEEFVFMKNTLSRLLKNYCKLLYRFNN